MKGVTGFQLSVIITIIIAVILIAFSYIAFQTGTEAAGGLFGKFIDAVYASICGMLGGWGSFILPGAC